MACFLQAAFPAFRGPHTALAYPANECRPRQVGGGLGTGEMVRASHNRGAMQHPDQPEPFQGGKLG
jgi:hypothetical protein